MNPPDGDDDGAGVPDVPNPGGSPHHCANEKNKADKEILIHHNSLAQSKDRAQMTASTAMSIVSVALLKAVLDTSPKTNRFYYVELTLIVVALALQITAGLMSLMVSNMLSYAEKYGKNFCEDWRMNCWPWRCVKRINHPGARRVDSAAEARADGDLGEHISLDPMRPSDTERPWMNQAHNIEPIQDACDCFPYTCTSRVYQPQDYITFRNLGVWKSRRDYIEQRASEAKDHLDTLKTDIDDKQTQLKDAESHLAHGNVPNKEELEQEVAQLKQSIQTLTTEKENWAKVMLEQVVSRHQGALLQEYDRSIRKARVMKVVSFWQNIITVILYVVTILNLFITGFGLAARGGGGQGYANHTAGLF